MNLNHVHLGTKDLQASIAFYTNYFGFKKKFDHGQGVFLVNSDNFLLAIDPVEVLHKFPEWFHLGFCLNSEIEVFNLYEKMKNSNVSIVRELISEKGEFASFYLKDPDDNKLEVSWDND